MVIAVAAALALLFRFTSVGLRMRGAAFAPEIARLLGVRVGRMLTLGWALAAMTGSLAGVLVAPSVFLGPNSFDPILIIGFVAAVLGGLDSPPGAVVGGLVLGLALSYVSGLRGLVAGPAGGARDPRGRADDPPDRAVLGDQGAAGVTRRRRRGEPRSARSTLLRSLTLVVVVGAGAAPAHGLVQRLPQPPARLRRLLLLRARRPHGARRLERADLARPRRVHGGRRLHVRAAEPERALVGVPGARGLRGRGAVDRDPGRRGREPAARAVPGRRDARVRGRASGAGGQVPVAVRRRERPGDQPADPSAVARLELPARALGGLDRLRRRADRAVRALQRDPQRHRPLVAGGARRRDRGRRWPACASGAGRRSRSRSAPPRPGSAAASWPR